MMRSAHLTILLSIINNVVALSETRYFKLQPIEDGYETLPETITSQSIVQCCIFCSMNSLCEAVMLKDQNCIMLSNIKVSDRSDVSAYVMQNRPVMKIFQISKIEIKESDEDDGALGYFHKLSLEICNENSKCCHFDPSPSKFEDLDTFVGNDLKDCQDFELGEIGSVKIWIAEDDFPVISDIWLGEWVKIYVGDQGHFNCLIPKWLAHEFDVDYDYEPELYLECTLEK